MINCHWDAGGLKPLVLKSLATFMWVFFFTLNAAVAHGRERVCQQRLYEQRQADRTFAVEVDQDDNALTGGVNCAPVGPTPGGDDGDLVFRCDLLLD